VVDVLCSVVVVQCGLCSSAAPCPQPGKVVVVPGAVVLVVVFSGVVDGGATVEVVEQLSNG
jgi:hypothetical protein